MFMVNTANLQAVDRDECDTNGTSKICSALFSKGCVETLYTRVGTSNGTRTACAYLRDFEYA